ncbi:MAG: NAD(P)H-hydrate dehydratase [Bacteroidota bacterium]
MNSANKIFSASQLKQLDQLTIEREPVSSLNLMERAASCCADWILQHLPQEKTYFIFCGEGNNGGDGWAIARMLLQLQYTVQVYKVVITGKQSPDCAANEQRLADLHLTKINRLADTTDLPVISENDIVVDAIFGTGLTRPITGWVTELIGHINQSEVTILAIDIPSGLFADGHSDPSSSIISAAYTLSFQFPKLGFLFPENQNHVGEWKLLDIQLNKTAIAQLPVSNYLLTGEWISSLRKPRTKFSHKGNFGHALLIAGSYGKMGAAVLAVNACLRIGVGLVTAHVPRCGYEIIQTTSPVAMASVDTNETLIGDELDMGSFSAAGIGPGIGTGRPTQATLHYLLQHAQKPMVLDADAINILGLNPDWLALLPVGSILTPHPKEFERIAGKAANDFDRWNLQRSFSKKYKVHIVLKGAHTCITTPEGETYFNNTGNPGMAKAGSGDVLTGILTGLLAQGYEPLYACLIGVYVHGYAGDLAAESIGQTGMTAEDLVNYLPAAFKNLQ